MPRTARRCYRYAQTIRQEGLDGPARPVFPPDQPLHVIQRGNNRGAIFFAVEDYARYHDWLAEAAGRYFCRLHAYVLMTNHVHLLVTPQHEERLRMIASLTLPNGIRRAARRQRSNRPCPKDPKDRSDRLT